MHRDQHHTRLSSNAGVDQLGDALVIGREDFTTARLALRWRQILISRDLGQFADRRDRAVEARLAVAVDDQPRIALQYRRRIQRLGQPFGDPGDADIPGDVPLPLALRQAQRAQPVRDRPPGMIAAQQEIGAARRPQHPHRRGIVLREQAQFGVVHGQ